MFVADIKRFIGHFKWNLSILGANNLSGDLSFHQFYVEWNAYQLILFFKRKFSLAYELWWFCSLIRDVVPVKFCSFTAFLTCGYLLLYLIWRKGIHLLIVFLFHSFVGGILCAFEQYGEWKLMFFSLIWGKKRRHGFWSLVTWS